MLILPLGHDQHSHSLPWPNKGKNKDPTHHSLCHQTELLLLMKRQKSIQKFQTTPKSIVFCTVTTL